MPDPDPQVMRLVRQLDEERRARITAERQATALRATLARLKTQRTRDSKPPSEAPPRRPQGC